MTSPITSYAIVLTYSDGSGILGAFGPYPTKEAAEAGQIALGEMPLAEGRLEVAALFGAPGAPAAFPMIVHPATKDA